VRDRPSAPPDLVAGVEVFHGTFLLVGVQQPLGAARILCPS
jgi:hypothetical protein